jgi:hypothetical protein
VQKKKVSMYERGKEVCSCAEKMSFIKFLTR